MADHQQTHSTYSVRLEPDLRQQLDDLAKWQDRRAADVIRRLIKVAHAEALQQRQQEEQQGPE